MNLKLFLVAKVFCLRHSQVALRLLNGVMAT